MSSFLQWSQWSGSGSGLAGTVALIKESLNTGMFKLVKSANGGKHLFDVIW